MFKFLSKRTVKEPDHEYIGCPHDWEMVDISEEYFYRGQIHYSDGRHYYHKDDVIESIVNKNFFSNAGQYVCIICGECRDEIAEAKKQIAEREKEQKSRKELARLLWDKCDKSDNEKP